MDILSIDNSSEIYKNFWGAKKNIKNNIFNSQKKLSHDYHF